MAATTGVRLTIKINFGQQIRFCGWSESYDMGFADLPTAAAAQASIQAFLRDRAMCLGIGPIIMSAVLTAYVVPVNLGQPPARRGTLALPVPVAPAAGMAYNPAFVPKSLFATGYDYTADFSPTVYYLAAQTALAGTPVYRRNLWLAGLPDAADQTDTAQIIEPQTRTAVTKFIGDLNNTNTSLGGKCNISIKSLDRSGINPIHQCTAFNAMALTYTVPAHGFVAGQPIQAEGFRAPLGGVAPKGRYTVLQRIDADTFTLQGAAAMTAGTKLGGFRAVIYAFNKIEVVDGLGFTKRNKGRPFELSVGRRSIQKIRRA